MYTTDSEMVKLIEEQIFTKMKGQKLKPNEIILSIWTTYGIMVDELLVKYVLDWYVRRGRLVKADGAYMERTKYTRASYKDSRDNGDDLSR